MSRDIFFDTQKRKKMYILSYVTASGSVVYCHVVIAALWIAILRVIKEYVYVCSVFKEDNSAALPPGTGHVFKQVPHGFIFKAELYISCLYV